eukprot:11702550-Prorocentrum_lima.AAC.1
MTSSLVGSEMCIRDRLTMSTYCKVDPRVHGIDSHSIGLLFGASRISSIAVSYTHLTLPTICSV